MLRNGAEEALIGAKPHTIVLKGRDGGWKRRRRSKKKIAQEKEEKEGMPKEWRRFTERDSRSDEGRVRVDQRDGSVDSLQVTRAGALNGC